MQATTTRKKEIYDIATALMAQHGLTGWRFQWDNAKRRAGVCKYGPKVIGMSEVYAERATDADIRNTILHEIAHAIAGHSAGHGPAWRAVARRIGCNAERCANTPEDMPKGRYEAVCCSCDRTVAWRWRLSGNIRYAVHTACKNKPKGGTLRWKDHGPQGA